MTVRSSSGFQTRPDGPVSGLLGVQVAIAPDHVAEAVRAGRGCSAPGTSARRDRSCRGRCPDCRLSVWAQRKLSMPKPKEAEADVVELGHGRRPETRAPARPQQQAVERAEGGAQLRIEGRAEVVVVLPAARQVDAPDVPAVGSSSRRTVPSRPAHRSVSSRGLCPGNRRPGSARRSAGRSLRRDTRRPAATGTAPLLELEGVEQHAEVAAHDPGLVRADRAAGGRRGGGDKLRRRDRGRSRRCRCWPRRGRSRTLVDQCPWDRVADAQPDADGIGLPAANTGRRAPSPCRRASRLCPGRLPGSRPACRRTKLSLGPPGMLR